MQCFTWQHPFRKDEKCCCEPARLCAGRDSVATRVWTGLALYLLLVAGEMRFLTQTGLAISAWCAPLLIQPLTCKTPVPGRCLVTHPACRW